MPKLDIARLYLSNDRCTASKNLARKPDLELTKSILIKDRETQIMVSERTLFEKMPIQSMF